ncbi:hypothetical protein KUTeg_012441 [Tegillarca granosa]|uniref:Uncharacterized protein n=1 Tax=Tegillarca granosa TaxID=220873 RepID=A0ABQ9F1Z0_TEGGR|nr:hypothetical protein KUTeg_012441 [Tegillarca granosa]
MKSGMEWLIIYPFQVSSTYPGKVFLKKCDDDESETTFTLVKRSVDQVPLNRPDPVTPKGLSRDRQKYLFKSVRPYVRPMFSGHYMPSTVRGVIFIL